MSQTIEQIREQLSGASLTPHRWGPERTGSREERSRAATANEVTNVHLTKYKKTILNTKMEEWKAVIKVSAFARAWFDSTTFPYIEAQRLFHKDRREEIIKEVARLNSVLQEKTQALDSKRTSIMEEAKRVMGKSYDASLYPESWSKLFWIEFREHNIDPPSYLQREDAEEYKKELKRRLMDVENSMRTFEREVNTQLAKSIQRMTHNLDNDKIRSSNLTSFASLFNRISQMRFEGTAVFKQQMKEVKAIIEGVDITELKSQSGLREETKEKLEGLFKKYKNLRETITQKGKEE